MSITPSARTLIYARGKKGRRPAGDDIKHRSCELGHRTGSRALGGRPYRKTHDRPGFRGFHRLTGAILAYGRTLSLLVALEEREEFFAMIAQLDLPASVTGWAH